MSLKGGVQWDIAHVASAQAPVFSHPRVVNGKLRLYLGCGDDYWLGNNMFRMLEAGGQLINGLRQLAKCAPKVLEAEGILESYVKAVRGFHAFDLHQREHRGMYVALRSGLSN